MNKNVEDFFYLRTQKGKSPIFLSEGISIWKILLDVTFEIASPKRIQRRPSISLDGCPIIFSTKVTSATEEPDFRVLVEPGGVGITVSEQINLSLKAVDTLLHTLKWNSATEQLNSIVSNILPKDVEAANRLWGGIWLGLSLSKTDVELRMYLNMRHGDEVSRWQRFANVITNFSDETIAEDLLEFITKVSVHSIPVGMGLVISQHMRGLRLYAGMHKPSVETIRASVFGGVDEELNAFDEVSTIFNDAYGCFLNQSVTLGYDFKFNDFGALQTTISRTKIDIDCSNFQKVDSFTPLINTLLTEWNLNPEKLNVFLTDMRSCFGGYKIDYVSFGIDKGQKHATFYCRPDGYQQIYSE